MIFYANWYESNVKKWSDTTKTFVYRPRSRLSRELLIVHKFYINFIYVISNDLSLQKRFDKKFQLLTSADKK